MKKLRFLFVLSVVSVLSISAQTITKAPENIALTENIKVSSETAETKIEPVPANDKNSETAISEEQKTQTVAAESSNVVAPVQADDKAPEAAPKKSLGAFSTGNQEIDGYIEEASALYNIDPLLIYAQMNQESRFKRKATSHKGASGLMQLMPDTAKRFGVKNIYNPKQNIKAGVKYMRWLLDRFGGDVQLALAGYNAGEGSVKKYGNKIPPYRETRNYVARIMSHYEQITNQISFSTTAATDKTTEALVRGF